MVRAEVRMRKIKLTIKQCQDCLQACYFANNHPWPMSLALLDSVEYLKQLKNVLNNKPEVRE